MQTDFFSKKPQNPADSLKRRTGRGLSALASAFAGAGALAVASCSLLENDACCWIEIEAYSGQPADSTYNSSLLDSAGLAGVEVRILGETLVAEDFKPSRIGTATVTPQLAVAESGGLSVWVRVAQGDRNAAVGAMSWTLKSNTKWVLRIERTSQPLWVEQLLHEDRCLSNIAPCQYKRLPIPKDLANYPGEHLWVVLVDFPAKVPDGAVY